LLTLLWLDFAQHSEAMNEAQLRRVERSRNSANLEDWMTCEPIMAQTNQQM
jgi:hypothetical protein